MKFWPRRGLVALHRGTFPIPPYNYLHKPVIDELEQLVVQWRDPEDPAGVIQSPPGDPRLFPPHNREEAPRLAPAPPPPPLPAPPPPRSTPTLPPTTRPPHLPTS